jgi:hypothetical protein
LITRRELEQLTTAVTHPKLHARMDQRRAGDRVDAVPDLGRLAPQKFTPRSEGGFRVIAARR